MSSYFPDHVTHTYQDRTAEYIYTIEIVEPTDEEVRRLWHWIWLSKEQRLKEAVNRGVLPDPNRVFNSQTDHNGHQHPIIIDTDSDSFMCLDCGDQEELCNPIACCCPVLERLDILVNPQNPRHWETMIGRTRQRLEHNLRLACQESLRWYFIEVFGSGVNGYFAFYGGKRPNEKTDPKLYAIIEPHMLIKS